MLTSYDVYASMYALDKEDENFCQQEHIAHYQLSRYFTNASRGIKDEVFAPKRAELYGMSPYCFEMLQGYYRYKVVSSHFFIQGQN